MTVHGGPDGLQAILHDFSTNASPLGPPPELAQALSCADRGRYPDPAYGALKQNLAAWHGVDVSRIVPTAGTSEAIRRITLAARLAGITTAWAPRPGYGDYAAAARALGLRLREYADESQLRTAFVDGPPRALVWLCEPCNPTGESLSPGFWRLLQRLLPSFDGVVALDRAYEPLRLDGLDPVPEAVASSTWQCFSPNKALGLTGVRAGYAIAPRVWVRARVRAQARSQAQAQAVHAHVEALAPSWVLSAEGVALLAHLHTPSTRTWLGAARATLCDWSTAQREMLDALGWTQRPSVVPFWLARPVDDGSLARRLRGLRQAGIKLRDAASLGLPGWVRVSAQPLPSQLALRAAWARHDLVE